jgi:divalent metal cation (Fe/Co/Zn/Cd) transporter
VLGLAIVFEGISWGIAYQEFKKTLGDRSFISGIIDSKDPTVAVVLMEDSAAMLGLVIALVGIALGEYLGMPELDGWAALTIGFVLALTAAFLAIETKSLLIGEAADPALVKEVEHLAGLEAAIEKVGDVLTRHLGPQDVLVNLSVDFRNDVPAGKIEEIIAQIDARLKKAHPEVTRVFIEAENLSRVRR